MILIPIRTIPEKNRREHWTVSSKRTQEQRSLTTMFVNQKKVPGRKPTRILLRRVSPRFLDVPDGLSCALAAIRDGVADAFGTDDSVRAGITWEYAQKKGKPPCVEVELFYE
jgi:hypothetical protein